MTRRILTIDGGGMRGVFSAAVIEQMELINGDKPANEIFDCFCGTSAGSLIAAGLANGMRAREIKELFLTVAKQSGDLVAEGASSANSLTPAEKRQAATTALETMLKTV